MDFQHTTVEVDVRPLQPQQFAAPKSGGKVKVVELVHTAVPGLLEEERLWYESQEEDLSYYGNLAAEENVQVKQMLEENRQAVETVKVDETADTQKEANTEDEEDAQTNAGDGKLAPELIIGVPVGFVNVVQSKELIMQADVPYIVARGRKGGSNIAACICNALLYMIDNNRGY